jgi:hypothetical protein
MHARPNCFPLVLLLRWRNCTKLCYRAALGWLNAGMDISFSSWNIAGCDFFSLKFPSLHKLGKLLSTHCLSQCRKPPPEK